MTPANDNRPPHYTAWEVLPWVLAIGVLFGALGWVMEAVR